MKLHTCGAPASQIDFYLRHHGAFYDHLEYRRTREAFTARLAAVHAAPADGVEIRRHLDLLEDAEAAGETNASREAAVRFHATIVEAIHKRMLIHIMASIYDLTRRGVFYNRAYLRTLIKAG